LENLYDSNCKNDKNEFILSKMNSIRIILILMVIMAFTGCRPRDADVQGSDQSDVRSTDSLPLIEFRNPIASLGKISSGEKVGIDFIFFNKGGGELIIQSAKTSCGCTVTKWNNESVIHGGQGKIRVIYDSSGELGIQNKSIHIVSNARNGNTDIMISAEVIN
jgi:hypothetical protein